MSPLSSFAAPYAVLEVFSYGLAMSRSGNTCLPTYKKIDMGTICSAIETGIVVLVLYIGSIIEWQFIQQQQLKQHLRR